MPLTSSQIRRTPIPLEFTCQHCGERVLGSFRWDRPPRRFCSDGCRDAASKRWILRTCVECGEQFESWRPKYRGKILPCPRCRERAKNWRKNSVRRSQYGRYPDPDAVRTMRRAAVGARCSSCDRVMVAEAYKSASAELDHIVPVALGGSHELRNLRMICRDCNLRRPKDGSDLRLVAS